MRRFLQVAATLLVLAVAGASIVQAAIPAVVEVALSAPGVRFAPGATVPVTVEATLPEVGSDSARVSVSTTDGLSLLGGETVGAAGKRVFRTTLGFLPTALGWGRADLTVERLNTAGLVVGRNTNSVFFLFEEGAVWLSTSSAIDLRLQRLAALGGSGALDAGELSTGARGEPGSAGSGLESVDSIIGSVIGSPPTDGREAGGDEPAAGGEPGAVVVEGRILWTDRDGNLHGLPRAVVQIFDAGGESAPLANASTDFDGRYVVSVSPTGGRDHLDLFVRVLAQSSAALVRAPGVDKPYFLQSTISEAVPVGSVVTKNLTAGNRATNQNAFSIHHALVVAAGYAGYLASSMPSRLDVVYPTNEASFSFFKPSPAELHIALKGPALKDLAAHAWDVIQHEYGHYVQAVGGFVNSAGGTHTFGVNLRTYDGERSRRDAVRLAWAEGWPTYFAIAAQRSMGAGSLGIPTVGNTRYEAPYLDLDVDIEAEIGKGADDELSVAGTLYDLYDADRDGLDAFAFSDRVQYQNFRSRAVADIGEAWGVLTLLTTDREKLLVGGVLAQNAVAPALTDPPDGFAPDPTEPLILRWKANSAIGPWKVTLPHPDLGWGLDNKVSGGVQVGNEVSYELDARRVEQALGWGGTLWFVEGGGAGGIVDNYWSNARFLGPKPDLVVVANWNPSMSARVPAIRDGLVRFLDGRSPRPNLLVEVVSFATSPSSSQRDPRIRVISRNTSDLREGMVQPTGSGTPVCSFPDLGSTVPALRQAAEDVRVGGAILLATDVPPGAATGMASTLDILREKKVKVYSLLSGDCPARALQPGVGEPRTLPSTVGAAVGGDEPGSGSSAPLDPIDDSGQPAMDDHGDRPDAATILLPNGPQLSGRAGDTDPDTGARDAADYFRAYLQGGTTYALFGEWLSPSGDTINANGLFTPNAQGYYLTARTSGAPVAYTIAPPATDPLNSAARTAAGFFSSLSTLTGGGFHYAAESAGYASAIDGILASLVGPALLSAAPSKIYSSDRPVTYRLQITGRGTNWKAGSSTVTFSGSGVASTAVSVSSPTSLTLEVTVAPDATTGVRDVTVTTADGTETEVVTGASLLQVLSAGIEPELAGLSPSRLDPGTNALLTVDGVNTSFSDRSSLSLGEEISIAGVRAVSPTRLVAEVSVAPDAYAGFRDLQVDGLSLSRALLVQPAADLFPLLTSVDPALGNDGQSLTVAVTGSGTHFIDGVTTASFGSGVTIDRVRVTSPTAALVDLTIAADALPGSRTVVLTTEDEVASLPAAFAVRVREVHIINGPVSTADTVDSQATTLLTVDAIGPADGTLAYAWTADCGELSSDGSFSDPTAREPIWTAPRNLVHVPVDCIIAVTVSSSASADQARASFAQQVLPEPYALTIVSGPSSDSDRLYSGGAAVVEVVAETAAPTPVQYSWTADCPSAENGSFADPSAASTLWTAPVVRARTLCQLQVAASAEGADSAQSFLLQTVLPVPSASARIYANVLPSSRSGRIGMPATVFAALVNDASVPAVNCTIAPTTTVPATFTFQRTNPATNAPVGAQGQPADLPPKGVQTFVIGLTPSRAFPPTEVLFAFDCANSDPAPAVIGLNSLLLSGSAGNPADVIAIVASPTNDGVARVPGPGGTGFFTVAGINIGSSNSLLVDAVANAAVPVVLSWCETTGTPDGSCLQPPSSYPLPSYLGLDLVKTYTVFVGGTGTSIPVDLASSRVTVRFRQGATIRGSTSIAVQTATTGNLAVVGE